MNLIHKHLYGGQFRINNKANFILGLLLVILIAVSLNAFSQSGEVNSNVKKIHAQGK